MILTGKYNHLALIKLGARFVRDEPDGNTYVEPDGLEVSGYAASVKSVTAERKIAEVKAEAKRRIIAQVPGASLENYRDKELIALMRSSRLLKKKEAGTITVAEQAKLDALDATAAKVEAIITASDEIEADIAASADPANFDVVNSPRWPA